MDILRVIYDNTEPNPSIAKYVLWVKTINTETFIYKYNNGKWVPLSATMSKIITTNTVQYKGDILTGVLDELIAQVLQLDTGLKKIENTIDEFNKIYITSKE